MVTTPSPVLYKTFCTEEKRHTAEYVASELTAVIKEIGEQKVLGLVTDNAAAMIKARRIICDDYKNITEYGCISHTLNLFIGDVMKCTSLRNLDGHCKQIVKEVSSSHIVLATFNKIQKEKRGVILALKLPVATRWGSILHCLESLVKCKFALKILVVSEEVGDKISNLVKKNCLDDDIFWIRVEKLINVLRPVVKWITKLEGDNLKMSEVVEAFKELNTTLEGDVPELPITKKEEEDLMKSFYDRKSKSLRPVHFAAALLNPQKRGSILTEDEHLKAMEFITAASNNDNIIIKELAEYVAKANFFSNDYIWQNVEEIDPLTWWGGFCSKTKLKKIATGILSLPPSSAATERSFSTYGFIHSAKRNRLTTKRAGMLTYIAHNLKLGTKEKIPREPENLPEPIPIDVEEEEPLNVLENQEDQSSDDEYSRWMHQDEEEIQ